MKLHMSKTTYGLVPSNDEAVDALAKIKAGAEVNCTISVPVNGKFRRKFFAMLDVAYQNHEWAEVETKWGRVKTSQGLFRKYVIVKAGHYEADMTPNGEIRAEPKSIAWAKMDDQEFERLYNDVLNVILAEFLTNWKGGDMDKAVNTLLGFA